MNRDEFWAMREYRENLMIERRVEGWIGKALLAVCALVVSGQLWIVGSCVLNDPAISAAMKMSSIVKPDWPEREKVTIFNKADWPERE